jgi:subtilisin-like proprotein convertase family protein
MAVLTQSNFSNISIPSVGASTPFPSNISISGKSGQVLRVAVRLNGVSHSWPDDVDVLLVGPGGAKSLVMSDVGGSVDANNLSLTFDQISKQSLGTPMATGVYAPTDSPSTSDSFASPAPSGPYSADFSLFQGANPNGEWSLYVQDDVGGDFGSIASGWSLKVFHGPDPVIGTPAADRFGPVFRASTYFGGDGPDLYNPGLRYARASRLSSLDHIVDFDTDNDRINHPGRSRKTAGKSFGSVSSLTARAIGRLFRPSLGGSPLGISQWGTFTSGAGEEERTFLLINDKIAGFDAKKDFLLEITGYYGTRALNQLNVV